MSCPQCGGLVRPPHDQDLFSCPWCASTLRAGEGIRVFRLRERARLDRHGAEAAFRAWLAGPDLRRHAAGDARFEVGGLHRISFLCAETGEGREVLPLSPLPFGDVTELSRVPAELVAVDGVQDGSRSGGPAPGEVSADLETVIPVDQASATDALRRAARLPGVKELRIEERLFFPVRYFLDGASFSAFVDASAGRVWSSRLPARPFAGSDRLVALGSMTVLFAEALFVPGLVLKAAAIIASAALLHPLLLRMLGRYG